MPRCGNSLLGVYESIFRTVREKKGPSPGGPRLEMKGCPDQPLTNGNVLTRFIKVSFVSESVTELDGSRVGEPRGLVSLGRKRWAQPTPHFFERRGGYRPVADVNPPL